MDDEDGPPLRIPALDELDPPIVLPGEEVRIYTRDQRRPTRYFAPDGTPIEGDVITSGQTFMRLRQRIGARRQSIITLERGEIMVSTVYLGIDLGSRRDAGPPIIWETMVFFGTWLDQYMWRYATRGAAMRNHEEVVRIICAYTGAHVSEERDGEVA